MRIRVPVLTILVGLLAITACGRDEELTVAPYSSPDVHAQQLRTFEALWSAVNENYVYQDILEDEWQAVYEGFQARLENQIEQDEFTSLMEEMLGELPPGAASLQSRAERLATDAAATSTFEGIGSYVAVRSEPEPRVLLLAVMPGSPAEEAGLQAHDAILAIDGVAVAAEEGMDVISRVRGPAGSDVILTVRSPGGEVRDVVVTRGTVDQGALNRLFWQPLGDTRTGYFLFPPGNYEGLLNDFVLAIQALEAGGDLNGLILDLRVVAAPQDWPAAQVLALFLNGDAGTAYSRTERRSISLPDVAEFIDLTDRPVAVLVGPDTTGPAEILAAVMQASERATILGRQTPGDLETLSSFYMPDGSRAFVETTSFRTVGGHDVGLLGVQPDVELDTDWDELTEQSDPVRDLALLMILGGDP